MCPKCKQRYEEQMIEMSDSYDDYCIQCELAESVAEDLKSVWITKKGERIKYSEMTTEHLLNTYNMLEKQRQSNGLTSHQWICFEALKNEKERRGI